MVFSCHHSFEPRVDARALKIAADAVAKEQMSDFDDVIACQVFDFDDVIKYPMFRHVM